MIITINLSKPDSIWKVLGKCFWVLYTSAITLTIIWLSWKAVDSHAISDYQYYLGLGVVILLINSAWRK